MLRFCVSEAHLVGPSMSVLRVFPTGYATCTIMDHCFAILIKEVIVVTYCYTTIDPDYISARMT